YMNAARSLIYSADGSLVYNPCAIDVWIRKVSDEGPEMSDIVRVPAGETVCLETDTMLTGCS
nr:hypothetical protein [Lachnospiraceae bacterium]